MLGREIFGYFHETKDNRPIPPAAGGRPAVEFWSGPNLKNVKPMVFDLTNLTIFLLLFIRL